MRDSLIYKAYSTGSRAMSFKKLAQLHGAKYRHGELVSSQVSQMDELQGNNIDQANPGCQP